MMTGVINVVGYDVDGKTQREAPEPGPANKKETHQPEDGGQLVRVKENKIAGVLVIVGGPEKPFYTKTSQTKFMPIFKDMVEID